MPFSGLTGGLREAQFSRALETGEGGIEALDGEKEKKKESILAGISKGLGIIVLTPRRSFRCGFVWGGCDSLWNGEVFSWLGSCCNMREASMRSTRVEAFERTLFGYVQLSHCKFITACIV